MVKRTLLPPKPTNFISNEQQEKEKAKLIKQMSLNCQQLEMAKKQVEPILQKLAEMHHTETMWVDMMVAGLPYDLKGRFFELLMQHRKAETLKAQKALGYHGTDERGAIQEVNPWKDDPTASGFLKKGKSRDPRQD